MHSDKRKVSIHLKHSIIDLWPCYRIVTVHVTLNCYLCACRGVAGTYTWYPKKWPTPPAIKDPLPNEMNTPPKTIVLAIINPRRMREGYCSWFVYLSVTTLAATYLVCESNLQCCKVPYGVPNAWFVWISPKTLCLPVLCHLQILSFLTLPELAIAWLNV